ncbi:hypothetical protein BGZ65_003591 [Modicella reniformis]|uniref:Letm1 RBD domain-containing protein n=1 Tax=Modicella reniformis TaxID=1440133 RepID=A0A9P6LZD4_9FUNG|nr:hypothetical protein BGZ65_003591 [Modicella reniformis]
MTGSIIRAAVRVGHQVNARSLSSVAHSSIRITGLLIHQQQFTVRHAPALSQMHRYAFNYYSTAPSPPSSLKNVTEAAVPVHPEPAPLENLTKALSAGTVGSGKEIVIQCRDGVKQLWVNKRIVKGLKKAQKEEGYQLTRREFQLILKTDTDIKRLIPFGLVFFFATEYIPLIIIFAPQLIPSTCVTPSQLEGRRKKIHEKRCVMTEKLIRMNRREITKEGLANYNSFIGIANKYGEAFDYKVIDREHLSSFCKFMGLNGFGPKFILEKRLNKHMGYLKQDDLLLQRDGINSLTFAELQVANEERGMRSLQVSKDHLEKSLGYWLKLNLSKDAHVPPGLMVFSRIFLLHSTFKSSPSSSSSSSSSLSSSSSSSA